jgi:hypothetical protein
MYKIFVKIYSLVRAYVGSASVKMCVCVMELKSQVLYFAAYVGWSVSGD